MLLSEYIEVLQAALLATGDKPVEMTQGGYYAEGWFADLHIPPTIDEYDGDGRADTDFYVLGHSYQSY